MPIKKSELNSSLWQSCEADRPGYSQLKVHIGEVKPTIFGHPEFTAFNQSATALFKKWTKAPPND